MASRAPWRAVACAIAQAIERLFATPTTSPCLPAKVTGMTSAPALAAGAAGTGPASGALAGPAAAAAARRTIPALTLALWNVLSRAVPRAALSRTVAWPLAGSRAGAAETWRLSGWLPLALPLSHRAMAAIALAVVALRVESAAAARRTDGEIRRLALRRL